MQLSPDEVWDTIEHTRDRIVYSETLVHALVLCCGSDHAFMVLPNLHS
jgi:hypothetical protein